MSSEFPSEKTPWSKLMFLLAVITAGIILMDVAFGERVSRFGSRSVDRVEHLVWLVVPALFCVIGFIFIAIGRRKR